MSEKEVGKRPQHPPPSFPCPSCPRCSSHNTKFCYYNNYSVSQPRYFCKDCRRYWTHGGALRNIPTSRKRARTDPLASSSLHFSMPHPSPMPTWNMGFPNNPVVGAGGASLSIGCGTFMPPGTETVQSLNGGGGFNQAPFMFNPGGGVNTAAFGAVTIGFGGGIPPPQPPPSITLLPPLSPLDPDHFRDFGFPLVQRPQNHPPPSPITWTGQNMVPNNANTTLTSLNSLVTIARDPTEAANVVNINEWSELNDMDIEAEPIRSYKPPSP